MNLIETAFSYFRAFSAKDIQALQALLAENVTLRDWSVEEHGRDAVFSEMNRGFQAFAAIKVEPHKIYVDGQTVISELLISLDATTIRVLDVLEFDSSGRIVAIRAYKG